MHDMGIVLNTNMLRLMWIRQSIFNKSNETWNTWKRKVWISTVPSKEDVAIHGISKGILLYANVAGGKKNIKNLECTNHAI